MSGRSERGGNTTDMSAHFWGGVLDCWKLSELGCIPPNWPGQPGENGVSRSEHFGFYLALLSVFRNLL